MTGQLTTSEVAFVVKSPLAFARCTSAAERRSVLCAPVFHSTAMIVHSGNRVVRSTADVSSGAELAIDVSDGTFGAHVD